MWHTCQQSQSKKLLVPCRTFPWNDCTPRCPARGNFLQSDLPSARKMSTKIHAAPYPAVVGGRLMSPHKFHLHHARVEQASPWQSSNLHSSFSVTSICWPLGPLREGGNGFKLCSCAFHILRLRQNKCWSAQVLLCYFGSVGERLSASFYIV